MNSVTEWYPKCSWSNDNNSEKKRNQSSTMHNIRAPQKWIGTNLRTRPTRCTSRFCPHDPIAIDNIISIPRYGCIDTTVSILLCICIILISEKIVFHFMFFNICWSIPFIMVAAIGVPHLGLRTFPRNGFRTPVHERAFLSIGNHGSSSRFLNPFVRIDSDKQFETHYIDTYR